jgi:tetratricopeptide (TPR) repeat protein
MNRISCFAVCTAITLTALATPSIAQDDASAAKATQVANYAISDLAAWQNQAARKYLQKQKAEFGSTPQFQTAWALLEVQDGAAGKKAMANRGTSGIAKMAENETVEAMAAYHYGEILYHQNMRKEANTAWQAAAKSAGATVDKDPYHATAQFYLGAALVRTKKYPQARTALLLAVRGGFDPAMVNHQIGLSYLFAESWKEATEAFNIGLTVDPRFAPMYFWRAMAAEKLNRKDKMLLDLDQYVKLAPHGPMAGKAKSILKSAGR